MLTDRTVESSLAKQSTNLRGLVVECSLRTRRVPGSNPTFRIPFITVRVRPGKRKNADSGNRSIDRPGARATRLKNNAEGGIRTRDPSVSERAFHH